MGYLDYAGLQHLWDKLKEKFAPKSHSHDDRYYTESEMDGKLNSKVNNNEAGANGLLSKLTTSWTATPTDNTYVIRQDTGGGNQFGRVKFSTIWNYIKGKADGTYQPKGNYAASGHTHDDRYYTESEMNAKLSKKAENIVLASDTNLNNITTPGFYSCGGGNKITNKPNNIDAIGLIVTHNASGNYYTQILTTSSNANTYRRTCLNGSWSGWTQDKYTDTNTWRGIQNNLTSDSTSDSLSAAQGKVLKGLVDGKAPNEHTHQYLSLYGARPANINFTKSTNGTGAMFHFVATSSTKTGKPPADSSILQLNWDNSSGWDSQLALSTTANPHVYYRNQQNGTWGNWSTLLDNLNYTDYAAKKEHTHTKSQITDFPASLKNPTALTIQTNGTTAAIYDGSAAKTVNITKGNIGLGNVDNTADKNKSVASAAKLTTARTVSGGFDITLSFNYDGSGNSTANIGFYSCKHSIGNTNNYPFHRFARLDTNKGAWVDKSITFLISQDYSGGGYGICRLVYRSNADSGSASVDAQWLVRKGFSVDTIQVAIKTDKTNGAYCDAFYKSSGTYMGVVIRAIASGGRSTSGRTWTLVDSNEVGGTTATDKKTSSECWKTIADAGTDLHKQSYSASAPAKDEGYVASAGSANTSSSCTGNSVSATKLTSSAGSATQPVYFNDGKPVAGTYTLGDASSKTVRTLGAVGNTGWTNKTTDDKYVPTMSFMAYWNGAYSSTSSNLQYCDRGRFGTIVTKNTGDYAVAGHTHLNGTKSGAVDWNTFITYGVYKIQNCTMDNARHAPPDEYAFGILQVLDSENNGGEKRIIQIYWPHSTAKGNHLWYRMHNSSDINAGWSGWTQIKKKPDTAGYADSAGSVAWGNVSGKPSSYPPSSHSHAYLPLGGGTMTGNITFSGIGNTNTSNRISWNGSTDGADIYYQTTNGDQGNLVLNLRDDSNCYLRIAQNGTFKSYFSPDDGNFHGNVNGTADKANSVDWSKVQNKPSSYTPASHTHNYAGSTSAGGAAISANALNPTVTLTGGDGNVTGYRLIGQVSIGQWGNYRCVMLVNSRHQGAGLVTVTIGNNTNSITQNNAYAEIKYWGPTSSGSVISSSSYQVYISSDGKIGYLFWQYYDYSPCVVRVLGSDFTISNGTWMTGIGSGYGKCVATTQINAASTANNATYSTYVKDISNSSDTTFAYSKPGMNYGDYTWLAGWNGYELRAVNKNQFATAGQGVTASGKTGAGIYYVRFGNGTQMCWGFYKESDHSGSTSFPVAFNNSQYSLSLTVTVSSNNAPYITGRSTTGFSYARHGTSYNDIQWIAVGTWK